MNGQVEFKGAPLDDGGPAFPAPELGRQQFSEPAVYWGMSLLDYLAAHVDLAPYAPLELLRSKLKRDPTVEELAAYIAAIRYVEATEMLKVRAAT